MIFGQPPLGFNPFSTVAHAVVKAHVVGTKAIAHAVRDPRVQQAAIAAGSAYGGRAGQYAQYAQQAQTMFRPPPGGPMPPPGPAPDGSDNADDVPAGPAAPIHKSNMLLYAGLAGLGLVVFLVLKK